MAAFLDDVAPPDREVHVVVVTHNGWIRAAQYLAGEAALGDFPSRPAAHLDPTVLRPVSRTSVTACGRGR